jgi:hypothetical protein
MTELEQFNAMLDRITTVEEEVEEDTVTLRVDNTQLFGGGYSGFFSEWAFDKETGQLLSVSHWEE